MASQVQTTTKLIRKNDQGSLRQALPTGTVDDAQCQYVAWHTRALLGKDW